MMKKMHKGFTLVEVLIGFVVITLAFIMLGTSFMRSVQTVKEDRRRSDMAFGLKNKMEQRRVDTVELVRAYNSYWDSAGNRWKINPSASTTQKNVKELIDRVSGNFGTPLPRPDRSYTCCGLNVEGYFVEAEEKGNKLYTFVSASHEDTRVPAIANSYIERTVPRFQYLEDGSATLTLNGNYSAVENDDLLYSLQHRWYISNRFGFPEGASGISYLSKSQLDYVDDPVTRTPRFNSDYRQVGERKEKLDVNPHDAIYRDVAVKYAVVPLGLNKYVGPESTSENLKYFIGLPLDAANDIYAHYSTDLVMNYNSSTDEAEGLTRFRDHTGSDEWYDVRSYIGMAPSANPLFLKKAELIHDPYGDYAKFTKVGEGLIKEKNFSLFIRVRDLEYDSGRSIILLQSPKIEAIPADKGKKMFQLALENKQLLLYTKEVKEDVAGGAIKYKIETTKKELLSDSRTNSSYVDVFKDATNLYEGYNVLLLKFSAGNLVKTEKFDLKSDPMNPFERIDLGGAADSLATGDFELAADGDGAAGITDIVMYEGQVSDSFAEKVGAYLLNRYMPN